ncbi:MAG: SAM-dependent methyltransferase [Holophagaceae bacterium]|nr:SAM-dependent methyltransferase [Holophagaceae bacterium]
MVAKIDSANQLSAIIEQMLSKAPLSASDYMSLALYHPEHGYYRQSELPWGFDGKDYFTALDLGPLLGETIAYMLHNIWLDLGCPCPFTIFEPGAGRGWLGRDILTAISGDFAKSVQYIHCDDCPAAGREAIVALKPWLKSGQARLAIQGEDIEPFVGAVISNELFDALPAQPWRWDGARWEREVLVSLNGDIQYCTAWEKGESLEAIKWFSQHAEGGLQPEDGSVWVDSMPEVLTDICRPLKKGLFLTIDYGDSAGRLIAKGASLRRYCQHKVDGKWWENPGKSDLTADVDFTRLAYLLECQGFMPKKTVSLGRWISNNAPIVEWEKQWQGLPQAERAKRSHNLLQLTMPNAMGERFKVLQAVKTPGNQ